MKNSLGIIKDLNFEKTGGWKLAKNKLSFSLSKYKTVSNALYAFVVDNDVKYIGKTVQTLQKRMNGYKNPGRTQLTNVRNNKNIIKFIRKGFNVEIFAFKGGKIKYKGYDVNLAAGLEDTLIDELDPEWNKL